MLDAFRSNRLAVCFVALIGWLSGFPVSAQESEETNSWGSSIASVFQQTNRRTQWKLLSQQRLDFDTHHPQGLTKADGKFYLSTVEKPAGRDAHIASSNEAPESNFGCGHLICFDERGKLQQSVPLGEGALYHPGGIDRDDEWIWIPVAEYRPDSSTIIYRVGLPDLAVTEVFRCSDHIGAVIRDYPRGP